MKFGPHLNKLSKRTSAVIVALMCFAIPLPVSAQNMLMHDMLHSGFSAIYMASPDALRQSMLDASKQGAQIRGVCGLLSSNFQNYGWESDPCGAVHWQSNIRSKNGYPLLYAEFGTGEKTTLILSAVHADELTPLPMGFRFARYLAEHPELYKEQNLHIIIAPLVNPDGFFIKKPTRTNANGIDLNRNFFTQDWYAKARNYWAQNRDRHPNHFPGYFPNSEIETLFQIRLIEKFRPDKILSIHSPLGFLDYDGPGDGGNAQLTPFERDAKTLVKRVAKDSQDYRVVDYTFYPGSLGNFAGNERRIPTVTLELPTTEPKKADEYWTQFLPGLIQAIRYPFHIEIMPSHDGSLFLGENFDDDAPATKKNI